MTLKAVILLSGGIDSATCLWWARQRAWQLYALSFHYHLRHEREIEASRHLARAAAVVEHREVALPFLREVKDLSLSEAHPLRRRAGVSSAYVPGRNAVFYAVAASWAEELAATQIVGGHGKMDPRLFPDASPSFFALFNRLLREGSWFARGGSLHIVTPLATLDKVGILRLALRLGVPLDRTWSCYERGERHCGQCAACLARLRAFRSLRKADPVPYEAR